MSPDQDLDHWLWELDGAKVMLHKVKEWVQHWDREEEIADDLYRKLELAIWGLEVAQGNVVDSE